jgi:hypothetical protein
MHHIILLCLTPDDFTRRGGELVLNGFIRLSVHVCSNNPWNCIAPYCALLYYFTLMSDDFTRQGESLVLNGFSMPVCIVNH